ncbi:MAG TPA: HAMP domain-containing sensor histidine kinase, partial [Pirellula sp.]|nr:HAMP domain-containing sensor histidine kinase [Pirellula sp.]
TTPSLDPYRIILVKMPYRDTQVWSMWSYAVLTSIAICTLALSLFFIHWVLKRLVIRPLSYMKNVSEEITQGDTKLRFLVDTEDEFHELSESFNRMLRHMTETQEQLESVNLEKDLRVDELARVNLQLFEANRLKGEFLTNMSHELRTPLNSILGFSEVLQGFESLTDKQRRYASNIQSSGRLLLDMINDILDLAKVEAGKMEVRPSEFCILSVIQAQCEIVMKMAEDKNIDLRVDSSRSEMRISQDQGKVQQILTNLLSNAIKFTPEGGLVTVFCEWQNEAELVLSVADTGVGVAPGDYEIIFEKFRQAKGVTGHDGLTREHSGTGLGLSIVRELCRLLGGDISLTSQLGCGSTFRVVLPRVYHETVSGASANGSL